jgi:hypothetical protein
MRCTAPGTAPVLVSSAIAPCRFRTREFTENHKDCWKHGAVQRVLCTSGITIAILTKWTSPPGHYEQTAVACRIMAEVDVFGRRPNLPCLGDANNENSVRNQQM